MEICFAQRFNDLCLRKHSRECFGPQKINQYAKTAPGLRSLKRAGTSGQILEGVEGGWEPGVLGKQSGVDTPALFLLLRDMNCSVYALIGGGLRLTERRT